MEETVEAAQKTGLYLVGDVVEKGVEARDVDALGAREKNSKWVGKKMLVGFLFQKN